MELTIKRPTKGVELCLDLSARSEWEQAEVELSELRKDPTVDQRLAGGPVTEAARRITELEEQMRASTVTFLLTAMSHREWSRLRTEHPPRPGDDQDKTMGFNTESLFDEAVPASILSVTGPDGEPVEWSSESWAQLADEMTNKQYLDFQLAVLSLNQGDMGARLPKSLSASLTMARSAKN